MFITSTEQQNIPSLAVSKNEEPHLSDSQMIIFRVESEFSKEIVRRPKHSFLLNGALQCYCNRKKVL